MLKRTLVGAACILLALLCGILGEVYLRGSSQKLLEVLALQEDASAQAVFAQAEAALEVWDRVSPLLGAIIKHSDADTLGQLFALLRQAANDGNAEQALLQLRACAAAVDVLCEGERLQWQNILRINPLNNVNFSDKTIYF